MKKRGLGGVMRKDRYSTSASLFRFMRATAFLLPITGCDITNPMVQEMEAAYATTMRKHADTHEARKAAATQVVQKYFRPGMKAEEAFKRLRQLKQQGFNVSENRHEGEHTWPDGEFKSYPDETTRLLDEIFSSTIQKASANFLQKRNTALKYHYLPQSMLL